MVLDKTGHFHLFRSNNCDTDQVVNFDQNTGGILIKLYVI